MSKISLLDYVRTTSQFANDPARAGQRVRRQGWLFGFDGGSSTRFCIFAIHTRFNAFEWIVQDAEHLDDLTGLPSVIAQEACAHTAYMRAIEGSLP